MQFEDPIFSKPFELSVVFLSHRFQTRFSLYVSVVSFTLSGNILLMYG